MSEGPVPDPIVLSNSLDTTIGFNTKLGCNTIAILWCDWRGDDVDVQEVQWHLPGSHSPPPTPDQLHTVEDPEEKETVLAPEEEEAYPHFLQGEQRNEAAQDLIGLERRDGTAITEPGRPRRVMRRVNKFV